MELGTARQLMNELVFEATDSQSFVKNKKVDVIEAGMSDDAYVSMQELQDAYGISRYHLTKYLKEIGASPIGERKNYVDGKRTRGVGKVVYPKRVLQDLEDHLSQNADVDLIKAMAQKILEEP